MVVDLKQDLPQGKVVPANNLPDDGEACPNLYFINPPTILYACPDFEEGSAVDVSKLYDKYYSVVSFTVGDLTDCWWNFSDPYFFRIYSIDAIGRESTIFFDFNVLSPNISIKHLNWGNINVSGTTYYAEIFFPVWTGGGTPLKGRLGTIVFKVKDCMTQ